MWEALHASAGLSLEELAESCAARGYVDTFTQKFSLDDVPILLPASILYHLKEMKERKIIEVDLRPKA